MSYSTLDFVWAVISIITVLLILAVSILASIILHSKKIRKSEKKFRTLYERVFDALVLIDKDGRIIDVNESACALMGVAGEQFAKREIIDFIAENRRSDFMEDFARASRGQSLYLGEFKLNSMREEEVHAEVGCTGLEIHDQNYVLASFRDITGRKLAEARLRDKNIALHGVLASLEKEKVRIKRQVADAVEHVLVPSLEKLIRPDGTVNMAHYKSLKESFGEISALTVDMGGAMNKLSPREMEICKLTRNGLTAKEIADALNITVATVEKHKEKIRKKLKISNKKINLATHLKSLISKAG